MTWKQWGEKLVWHGEMRHTVYKSQHTSRFYAKSGLETHGAYATQAMAQLACKARDDKIKSIHSETGA